MNINQENYADYRKRLASELKSNPQDRKDRLAAAQNDPQYYVAKYSKREGRQLSLEETFSIISPGFSILSRDKTNPDSEFNELVLNSIKKVHNFSEIDIAYRKLLDSKDTQERKKLETELLEQLPRINELHQTYISQLLLLKNMYSLAKARFVVANELDKILSLDLNNLRDLIGKKEDSGEDTNDLIDKFQEIREKIYGDGGIRDSRFINSGLLQDIPKVLNSVKESSSTLISLIDFLNKIKPRETPVSRVSLMDRIEFEDTPDGYVSVFHTSRSDAIESIDEFGLLTTRQSEYSKEIQSYIDKYKNSINRRYIEDVENISRANCIFAFLNDDDYESYFGGERGTVLLEIKVDSKNCYVVDFELSTQLLQTSIMKTSILDSFMGNSYIYDDFKGYWSKVVSLEDYRKYYVDGKLVEGAPEGFPEYIESPEIIITKDIPQNHIRVVNKT